MELNIICPKCSKLFKSIDKICSNNECDYSIDKENQTFLYNEALNSFNSILLLIKNKNLLESWELLKEKIFIIHL